MKVTALVTDTMIDSSGVPFVTVCRVFQEGCSPPRGEPRVRGLQRWQLYPGTYFHMGKAGGTVFGFGTANGAGFLPGIATRQVVRLVPVPVGNLCTYSLGTPGRRQTDRHKAHTFDGYVT